MNGHTLFMLVGLKQLNKNACPRGNVFQEVHSEDVMTGIVEKLIYLIRSHFLQRLRFFICPTQSDSFLLLFRCKNKLMQLRRAQRLDSSSSG